MKRSDYIILFREDNGEPVFWKVPKRRPLMRTFRLLRDLADGKYIVEGCMRAIGPTEKDLQEAYRSYKSQRALVSPDLVRL